MDAVSGSGWDRTGARLGSYSSLHANTEVSTKGQT